VQAIVMAAGEGRRLRPLTERWPKPILPIDGRPVIATLLRELAASGCERATIVAGHLAEQVEELAADGAFGLETRFVRQPRADGSADAVRRALAAGATAPCLITAADTVYGAGDTGRFAEAFRASRAAGAIAVRADPPPGPGKPGVRIDAAGRVERMIDQEGGSGLSAAPLWGLGAELLAYLEDLPGPPFELAEAYQRAIDAGVTIVAVEIGRTRDLTDPLDLVRENFRYLMR
jgi:NDP-sugar pyrophosphorylase family protein